jgi:hypothetical protein
MMVSSTGPGIHIPLKDFYITFGKADFRFPSKILRREYFGVAPSGSKFGTDLS